MLPRLIPAALGLLAFSLVVDAGAHIRVLSPQSRHGEDDQKYEPCGAYETATGVPYQYEPGRTITLRVEEYIDHNSHYRVAFDPDGHDDFISPVDEYDVYNDDNVLIDEIADQDGGIIDIEVTLPDGPCDDCTLQLIQVMKDDFGMTFSGNYFACIDFAAEGKSLDGDDGGGDDETGGSASDEDGSGACACSSDATPSPLLALGLPLALSLRRRRWSARPAARPRDVHRG